MTIKLKRLGKKKIHERTVTISQNVDTLEDLLSDCVKSEVNRFNEKREDDKLLSFLTPADIQEQSESGKIGFEAIYNTDKANLEKSVEIALQGFRDGLFLVFIEEEEINSLDQKINIEESTVMTMIRMTFLTGTYW